MCEIEWDVEHVCGDKRVMHRRTIKRSLEKIIFTPCVLRLVSRLFQRMCSLPTVELQNKVYIWYLKKILPATWEVNKSLHGSHRDDEKTSYRSGKVISHGRDRWEPYHQRSYQIPWWCDLIGKYSWLLPLQVTFSRADSWLMNIHRRSSQLIILRTFQ